MFVENNLFSIKSSKREQFISITEDINNLVLRSGAEVGVVKIFIPHTTAAVTINQNANPDVIKDIQTILASSIKGHRLLNAEGNSDSHFKSSLFGVSLEIPIERRKMILGEWQGVFFCEFDGPRTRKIHVQVWGHQEKR
ncbi:secondary thiamine-phosphate synthase enzyme YjbQ [Candidatus Lokiarchaeum ossiferum]|uniref:secondary thiamine-phosphate synthase enzyme YjbQ n=1 Tax=Candidatus Lokiarchaeum ossiferum TaxID=2951803 RepID=UPI00352C34BE